MPLEIKPLIVKCFLTAWLPTSENPQRKKETVPESNPSIPSVLFPFLISHLSEKLPLCFLLPRQVENRYYHPPY